MGGRTILCVAAIFGGLAAAVPGWRADAQEPDCRFFRVQADGLIIAKEPSSEAIYIHILDKDDIVCVTRDQQVGDGSWGFIAHKLAKPNQRTPVEGWGDMRSLQPATPAEVAAVSDPAPLAATSGAAPAEDVVLRFSVPLDFGPRPVNGHSLEELIKGVPLFPPIEGLDESIWKKNCTSCHKWDRQTLCEQGATYVKNPKSVLRHPHPYGGAAKIAMMRWAKSGCL